MGEVPHRGLSIPFDAGRFEVVLHSTASGLQVLNQKVLGGSGLQDILKKNHNTYLQLFGPFCP